MSLAQQSPSPKTHELQRHVENDVALCTKLLALLKREQEALKNREIELIESIMTEKVPLMETLEQSAANRKQWIASQGFNENTEDNWNTYLKNLSDGGLREQWATLKTLYSDIRTQNELNGKLLSRHQGTLHRLLDIMRGKTSAPNLYNAAGYSSAAAASNNLGEA